MERRELALYQYLSRRLTGVRDVEVILDRRKSERRRAPEPRAQERRARRDRRRAQDERHYIGYTFVKRP